MLSGGFQEDMERSRYIHWLGGWVDGEGDVIQKYQGIFGFLNRLTFPSFSYQQYVDDFQPPDIWDKHLMLFVFQHLSCGVSIGVTLIGHTPTNRNRAI